jgi:hypothetical protein
LRIPGVGGREAEQHPTPNHDHDLVVDVDPVQMGRVRMPSRT